MNAVALILSAVLLSPAMQESETDRLRKEVERLKADNEAAQRQLEVAVAKLNELNDKLAKAQKEQKPMAGASAAYGDLLARDLRILGEKHVEMARDKET